MQWIFFPTVENSFFGRSSAKELNSKSKADPYLVDRGIQPYLNCIHLNLASVTMKSAELVTNIFLHEIWSGRISDKYIFTPVMRL